MSWVYIMRTAVLLVGRPGTGKTWLLKKFVSVILHNDGKVIFIDIDGEYDEFKGHPQVKKGQAGH